MSLSGVKLPLPLSTYMDSIYPRLRQDNTQVQGNGRKYNENNTPAPLSSFKRKYSRHSPNRKVTNYYHRHQNTQKSKVITLERVSFISTSHHHRTDDNPIIHNMGQKESVFSDPELDDYQDLTFFTKREILLCFSRFKALAPEEVAQNKEVRLPMEIMLSFPELRVNPFGDRICLVFSSSRDGDCTFEDFLDMMSVFSEEAPISVKAEYAFRIFDFDGDDMLGPEDMEEIIRRLLGDEILPISEINQLVQNLTAEADLDDDGMLSFAEFEHVVAKSTDFEQAFRMRL